MSVEPIDPAPTDVERESATDLQFPADAPPGAARTARRVLRHLKHTVGNVEVLLPVLLWATPLGSSRKITDATDLVIEGKPRSGNTFAVRAFEDAASAPISISSHVHEPSAVMRAVRLGIPTLVLVRQPEDSICSEKIAAPHASLTSMVRTWNAYHDKIWPYRAGFLVATFDQVTTDIAGVADRVNRRFGTSFDRFENSEANVSRVFDVIEERHLSVHGDTEHIMPRPSSSRTDAKRELLARLEQPEFRAPMAHAHELYERYAALAADTDT